MIGHANPFVLILGMHRSGTSCLAGSLQEKGLFLGNVKEYSPFNKKGNRENPEIFNIQEAILIDNGGAWDNPPEMISWTEEHKQRLRNIINRYPQDLPCGIKDPRTTLMIEKWLNLLSFRPVELVASFRHPLVCAASLKQRNNMPLGKGMDLWWVYNTKLIECVSNTKAFLVDFDESRDQYKDKVDSISKALGLGQTQKPEFYSEDLITAQLPEKKSRLPVHVEELYKQLQAYSREHHQHKRCP